MEHTALSDLRMGREIFRMFSNLFALEIDRSERPGWMEHRRRGLGAPAVPGDPPSPAGLSGDQGILKGGLGDEGAFWGLRVVVITNLFGSNNQQQLAH